MARPGKGAQAGAEAPETKPPAEPEPTPEKDWPWPGKGGTYVRDPATGALTRIDEHEEPGDDD